MITKEFKNNYIYQNIKILKFNKIYIIPLHENYKTLVSGIRKILQKLEPYCHVHRLENWMLLNGYPSSIEWKIENTPK